MAQDTSYAMGRLSAPKHAVRVILRVQLSPFAFHVASTASPVLQTLPTAKHAVLPVSVSISSNTSTVVAKSVPTGFLATRPLTTVILVIMAAPLVWARASPNATPVEISQTPTT